MPGDDLASEGNKNLPKSLLDHKDHNPHARIKWVEHVVVAIDVVHVKHIGVRPLCWPALRQLKPIAAVLEAGCAFDDYRPLDAETVFPAENGVEALVGNAYVAAFPSVSPIHLRLLMLTAVLFLSAPGLIAIPPLLLFLSAPGIFLLLPLLL